MGIIRRSKNIIMTYMGSSYEDFDLYFSSEPDSEIPEYYQDEELDFYTDDRSISKDSDETCDAEIAQALFKGLIVQGIDTKRTNVTGKYAIQVLFPNKFFNSTDNHGIYFTLTMTSFVMLIIVGIPLFFLKHISIPRSVSFYLTFMIALSFVMIGSWIIVNVMSEVEAQVEEPEHTFEIDSRVAGIALWELDKKVRKTLQIGKNLLIGPNTIRKTLQIGKNFLIGPNTNETQENSDQCISFDIIQPGSLKYLIERFSIQDPIKEKQMSTFLTLGFVWIANMSLIPCGYYTSVLINNKTQEEIRINEIQTSLVGVVGWILVISTCSCLVSRLLN